MRETFSRSCVICHGGRRSFAVAIVAALLASVLAPPVAASQGISGKVTDASGQPVRPIRIYVTTRTGDVVADTATAQDGTYVVPVEPGTYSVLFTGWGGSYNNYVPQWFDRKTAGGFFYDPSEAEDADPVTVMSGFVTRDIDAVLEWGGAISGHVRDGWGAPVEAASITVYREDGRAVAFRDTDDTGAYRTGGLSSGSYRVGFSRQGYIGEYHAGRPNIESADAVSVTLGEETTGIDAVLACASACSEPTPTPRPSPTPTPTPTPTPPSNCAIAHVYIATDQLTVDICPAPVPLG